jgi:subtilase-type serine protease
VFVGPDGTLRGTGIVPSTVLSGTVAPGNSIGTLTVNGNFVQNASSGDGGENWSTIDLGERWP